MVSDQGNPTPEVELVITQPMLRSSVKTVINAANAASGIGRIMPRAGLCRVREEVDLFSEDL
jgi:hypothetical protein